MGRSFNGDFIGCDSEINKLPPFGRTIDSIGQIMEENYSFNSSDLGKKNNDLDLFPKSTVPTIKVSK